MSNSDSGSNLPPEPDDDAGINAIRLDADRARSELETTLDEIERRLSPQRIIQPAKHTITKAAAWVKDEYARDPVAFVTKAVAAAGTVAVVLFVSSRRPKDFGGPDQHLPSVASTASNRAASHGTKKMAGAGNG
jgi:hypothetical protein